MKNKLRLLILATLFMATSSWAVPMYYEFDLIFTEGPLIGNSYTVDVTLDGVTGVAGEIFKPNAGLLGLSTTIDGKTFDMFDDIDFPDSPEIRLLNGSLDVAVAVLRDVAGGYPEWQVTLRDSPLHTATYNAFQELSVPISYGSYDTDTWRSINPPEEVPAPATLVLFGLGLVGLGVSRRNRATLG